MSEWDSELFKKYNVPGPRYTSYPTVPYWETTPTQEQWIGHLSGALKVAKSQGHGSALYIHIPFCKSLCTYCGCNTRITRKTDVGDPYVTTILKEWKLYRELLGMAKIPLTEIHLGGGTPTFLQPREMERLIDGIISTADLVGEHEFSIEVDPRTTSREHLETLAKLGFTRISLGVQDFDPKVQDIVNRVQSVEQTRKVVDDARELGFTSVNFDLIYGLPLQTEQSVENTVRQTREIKPDRIAFYSYAHVPWIKPSQRRFTEADLPKDDAKRALYELGRRLLEESGYREVGMDHFALPTDSLWKSFNSGDLHRNFMGYISQQVAPQFGLGVSSIGDSWTAFSQNEKLLEKYVRGVEEGRLPILRGHVLNDEDLNIRRHILNLMTQLKTEWKNLDDECKFMAQVPGSLSELVSDGLVKLTENSIEITEKGRPFLRNICMALDARLARKSPDRELFSQTV